MRRPLLIVAAALLLSAALVGLVVREDRARAAGTEVLLPMRPLDPRSLLSGHYVIVDIVHPVAGACPALDPRHRWVALAPRGRVHVATGSGVSQAQATRPGAITVQATAHCGSGFAGGDQVQLRLKGVDRFHADQQEAQAIEKALNASRTGPAQVFAIVSIGADGQARLKGLEVGGRRTELSWF